MANATTNADNLDNAESKNEKPEEVVMSDDNDDNATMSNNNTDDPALGDDNAENVTKGKTSTNDVPSPSHRPIWVTPLESSIDDPPADESATKTAKGHAMKGHAFDPTDMRIYEFFIQGAPNPKDLEDIEEDQLLDIQ